MNASFRLTRELIDQIVFGMENQDRDYVLDTEEAAVVPAEQADPEATGERYIELPEWRSVDGYNLMEQFVATLHNPIYRERLRRILASGRGVFRQFKDTVRERREIERLWFTFKERRMREIVTEWYNDLRERDGLERLEATTTETETDQLVETDFVFRPAVHDEFDELRELDREAFSEIFADADEETVSVYYDHLRSGAPELGSEGTRVSVAETPAGDFAGFLWSITRSFGEVSVAFVEQIYVVPEFRGLGIARELLMRLCHQAHEERISEVHLSLEGSALDLESRFLSYGFSRRSCVVKMDVEQWHRSLTG